MQKCNGSDESGKAQTSNKRAGLAVDWIVCVAAVIIAIAACWAIWIAGGGTWFDQGLLSVIGYVGVAISLVGVLIAYLIFRHQKRESELAQHFQEMAQASQSKVLDELGHILQRVEDKMDKTLDRVATHLPDTDEETGAVDLWANVIPEADDVDARYLVSPSGKRRRVYLPGSVPLAVIGALVKAWDEAALTGRWTLSTLRGAFRAEGKGNHPWYLVFVPEGDDSEPRIWKLTRGPGGSDHAAPITDGREFR